MSDSEPSSTMLQDETVNRPSVTKKEDCSPLKELSVELSHLSPVPEPQHVPPKSLSPEKVEVAESAENKENAPIVPNRGLIVKKAVPLHSREKVANESEEVNNKEESKETTEVTYETLKTKKTRSGKEPKSKHNSKAKKKEEEEEEGNSDNSSDEKKDRKTNGKRTGKSDTKGKGGDDTLGYIERKKKKK